MIQQQASAPDWTFGDRVRKARRVAGMTTREFADALGITTAALSQYETDRSYPRRARELAERIELTTGVPAGWLVGEPPLSLERRRPRRRRRHLCVRTTHAVAGVA